MMLKSGGGDLKKLFIILSLLFSFFVGQDPPEEFEFNQSTAQAFYFFNEVFLNGEPIASGDWVATFKGETCVGSRQWDISSCGNGICDAWAMGDDGSESTDGYMQMGDIPTFKIYDSSSGNIYDAIPSEEVVPWSINLFSMNSLLEAGSVIGCTNPGACNYNPDATEDDGNCQYFDCTGECGGTVVVDECGICGGDGLSCAQDSGDVNQDGFINILDIVLGINIILDNIDDPTEAQLWALDFNEDGYTDILDLVQMVNWILYGTITDIDGNVYGTVQIGDQLWMSENLKTTHYNNGDEIPNITNSEDWSGLLTGGYCDYNNTSDSSETYGRLYNWYAVNEGGLCMEGWHVPSDDEWVILASYLDENNNPGEWQSSFIAGGMMKQMGIDYWESPNTGATNESGFSALPGGFRSQVDGLYRYISTANYLWSSSEGIGRGLLYDDSILYTIGGNLGNGFSIRCLKD